MVKILKSLVMFFLISIVILAIAMVIFLKTFDFNRLKPPIITAGQILIDRPFNFSRIDAGFSFKNGIEVRLSDIVIGEKADFGKDNFLTAREVSLGLSLKDLIFKRQIRFARIECKNLQLNIVRLKDGRINIQTLGVDKNGIDKSIISQKTEVKSRQKDSTFALGLPAFFINSLKIKGARFIYVDYSFEPKLRLVFDKTSFVAKNISLSDFFSIAMQTSFASNSNNIFVQAKGKFNIERLSFLLKDIKVKVDLSTLSLEELSSFIPSLQAVSLLEINSAPLTLDINDLEIAKDGLVVLKGSGTLTKGRFKIKGLIIPVEPFEADFNINESIINLERASLGIGRGRVTLSGNVSDYLFTQAYSLKANLKDIELGECLDQSLFPIKIKGRVFGDIEIKGSGFDPSHIFSKLISKCLLEIENVQLSDINILKIVLGKLSFVPNLIEILQSELPEGLKEIFTNKDTTIRDVKISIEVAAGKILIPLINLDADSFNFQAKGNINSDGSYMFSGSFLLPEGLSNQIVNAVGEMGFLLNQTKQICFPLMVSGKGLTISLYPDIKQIGFNAIQQKGKEVLERTLDKFLNREDKQSSNQPVNQNTVDNTSQISQDEQSVKKIEKKQRLIESIVETIFKSE